MKYNTRQKQAGELAVRSMSDKAQAFYSATDPLRVYEYDTDNGKRYSYDFGKGSGIIREGMEFDELQAEFEALAGDAELFNCENSQKKYSIAVTWKDGQTDNYDIEAELLADELEGIRTSDELQSASLDGVPVEITRGKK